MVIQAVLVPLTLGGHLARIGITTAGARAATGQFVQSLPFGAGYSLGTYLGFPKNYQSSNRYSNKVQRFQINENKMNYGRQRRNGYTGRKWFSFRKTSYYWKPTYHRKLRRTVYTHPNRGNY